jgi:hypothetical protein
LIAINAPARAPCYFCREGAITMFTQNVGALDRVLRIVAGLILISLVFVGPQTPWGWIGIIPLVTGLFSTCPLYRLIGVNTCRRV